MKMKHLTGILLLCFGISLATAAQTCKNDCRSCSLPTCVKQQSTVDKQKSTAGKPTAAAKAKGTTVEIIYFHGKQRCKTCAAIENEAKSVAEDELAALVKAGKVRLHTVDLTTPDGKRLAAKHKVSWSALYIVQHKGGKEKAIDLTKFAFANARNNPAKFRKELAGKVQGLLK